MVRYCCGNMIAECVHHAIVLTKHIEAQRLWFTQSRMIITDRFLLVQALEKEASKTSGGSLDSKNVEELHEKVCNSGYFLLFDA